jgi:hypothetical protein
MPVIIPNTKAEASEQATMIREGLQVHDAGCCTANEPCTLRKGMEIVLGQLTAQTARPAAHRTPVASTAPRPQGSGNGFGTSKTPRRNDREASEPQKNMIRKLAAAKNITEYLGQELETFLGAMKMADVDAAREHMLSQPWPYKKKVVADEPVAEVTEGMYKTANGDIYKVQRAVHGSGRLYAKKLTQDGDEWFFERIVGGMRKIAPADRMTMEQAREFGKLYGRCVRCAALLTDEESIERGMGPVCAGKI